MTRYTVQFIVAGYAMPDGRDVHHYSSKRAIGRALLQEHEQAEKYGAGYEPSEAVVWRGEHEDITDIYPDDCAIIGPRGGVRWDCC